MRFPRGLMQVLASPPPVVRRLFTELFGLNHPGRRRKCSTG